MTSFSPSSSHETDLLHFMDLSQDILSLIRHENAILLEKGELSFEAYVMKKMELMSDFEKKARKLLSSLTGKEGNSTQAMLIGEIQKVRDAIRINSNYQIETIRARAQEKIAQSACATPVSGSQGEIACH